jgi:hypothetical protein
VCAGPSKSVAQQVGGAAIETAGYMDGAGGEAGAEPHAARLTGGLARLMA